MISIGGGSVHSKSSKLEKAKQRVIGDLVRAEIRNKNLGPNDSVTIIVTKHGEENIGKGIPLQAGPDYALHIRYQQRIAFVTTGEIDYLLVGDRELKTGIVNGQIGMVHP